MAINMLVVSLTGKRPNINNANVLEYVGFFDNVEGLIFNGELEEYSFHSDVPGISISGVRLVDEKHNFEDSMIMFIEGEGPDASLPDDWANQYGNKIKLVVEEAAHHLTKQALSTGLHEAEVLNLFKGGVFGCKGMMAYILPKMQPVLETVFHASRRRAIGLADPSKVPPALGFSKVATVKEGVVAESGGRYWGKQYADGQVTVMGFGPIENAKVSDPKYCTHPSDMTHTNDANPEAVELAKATLRPVKITTTYEVGDPVPEVDPK